LRLSEERLLERDRVEREPDDREPLGFFLAVERDRVEPVERFPLPELVEDFLVVERRLLVEPLDREDREALERELPPLRAEVPAGGGLGVAGGALAAATAVVRAPATGTRGWKPSSRKAMIAPAATATAAARARRIPTFRSPGLAKNRHRMINTLKDPNAAVTAPRGAGMFTL
jgi:hypothetical protein